jgi:hypothetical protein
VIVMGRRKTPKQTAADAAVDAPLPVAPEEQRRMVAEAAYFRALGRGFQGGDPLDDWLAAEREINRLLPSAQQQKRELAAYERLRQAVGRILAESRSALSADNLRGVLEQAKTQLRKLGSDSADTIDKVAETVEKDMIGAAQRIGPRVEAFSDKTADLFQVWRDRGQQFLSTATHALGTWVQQVGTRLKPPVYRAGEMSATGTLECTACHEHLRLETPAHVPRCPKCGGREFHRL